MYAILSMIHNVYKVFPIDLAVNPNIEDLVKLESALPEQHTGTDREKNTG